eukprot:m.308891 g.308891  ORF g.308891 m.308891 type:complete len:426 (-) comp21989_c0_seq1:25-1302(-)
MSEELLLLAGSTWRKRTSGGSRHHAPEHKARTVELDLAKDFPELASAGDFFVVRESGSCNLVGRRVNAKQLLKYKHVLLSDLFMEFCTKSAGCEAEDVYFGLVSPMLWLFPESAKRLHLLPLCDRACYNDASGLNVAVTALEQLQQFGVTGPILRFVSGTASMSASDLHRHWQTCEQDLQSACGPSQPLQPREGRYFASAPHLLVWCVDPLVATKAATFVKQAKPHPIDIAPIKCGQVVFAESLVESYFDFPQVPLVRILSAAEELLSMDERSSIRCLDASFAGSCSLGEFFENDREFPFPNLEWLRIDMGSSVDLETLKFLLKLPQLRVISCFSIPKILEVAEECMQDKTCTRLVVTKMVFLTRTELEGDFAATLIQKYFPSQGPENLLAHMRRFLKQWYLLAEDIDRMERGTLGATIDEDSYD